ncbi:MAG: adenylate/guanylate cyclase domain-containing protein [Deltaproteobacteria bacterium]|nr:adenylate/guanylate cyclase domain-containing protein [Deltaproteobacteria bacterium]
MDEVILRKLSKKKDFSTFFSNLQAAVGSSVAVVDSDGRGIIGSNDTNATHRHPILFKDSPVAWVVGDGKAEAVATLMGVFVEKEAEKKALAAEALDKYRDINFIYDFSEKVVACFDVREVSRLAVDEIRKQTEVTSASIMTWSDEENKFEILVPYGKEHFPKAELGPGVGIAGHVLKTGMAEIINNVELDHRFVKSDIKIHSLICAPLKTGDKVMGVFNVSTHRPYNYTAADLRRLSNLAFQSALAIENSRLHTAALKHERIKTNLGRYLPQHLVSEVMNTSGDITLKSAKRRLVILFSDIRNFTSLSEDMEAVSLVGLLNKYFGDMVDIIFKHNGTLNKFVGDMILALYGAPEDMGNNEKRAIDTAVDMQRAIRAGNWPCPSRDFSVGIGINSGDVVVGNIGSVHHMDYTAIGDEVNIAQRLQAMARGGEILVGRHIQETMKGVYDFKARGSVEVKGKKRSVEVFEVLY